MQVHLTTEPPKERARSRIGVELWICKLESECPSLAVSKYRYRERDEGTRSNGSAMLLKDTAPTKRCDVLKVGNMTRLRVSTNYY